MRNIQSNIPGNTPTAASARTPAFSAHLHSAPSLFDSAWHVARDIAMGCWRPGRQHDRQLKALRALVLASLAGCADHESARLRRRVELAGSLDALLALRELLFCGIARARCQSVAAGFLAGFDRLVPHQPRTLAVARRHRSQRHDH